MPKPNLSQDRDGKPRVLRIFADSRAAKWDEKVVRSVFTDGVCVMTEMLAKFIRGGCAAFLVSISFLVSAPAQAGHLDWAGWPSADNEDGKMLIISGPFFSTPLIEPVIYLALPPDATQFHVQVFDGDNSELLDASKNYDVSGGPGATPGNFEYTIAADPLKDQSTAEIAALTTTDAAFADSTWSNWIGDGATTGRAVDPAAQSPSGVYFYRVNVKYVGAMPGYQFGNGFMVRVKSDSETSQAQISVFQNASVVGVPVNPIYDPDFNTPGNFYTGDWDFFYVAPNAIPLGADFTDNDADWVGSPDGAFPEDDGAPDDPKTISPDIRYELFNPLGDLLVFETQPSGNSVNNDFNVTPVEAGSYRWHWFGVDANNVYSLLVDGDLFIRVCVVNCDPFLVGDFVWEDLNGDGVQDPGEPGIPGVVLNLRGALGGLIEQTTTDPNGSYDFETDTGQYTIEVDPANSTPPTPGGKIGDLLWHDVNDNGVQDPGEPGLGNVTVNLLLVGPNGVPDPDPTDPLYDDVFVATVTTNVNGRYRFTDLAPGTYYVRVIDSNDIPAGLTLSTGTSPSATRSITATEVFDDLDFGYTDAVDTASVGDRVWNDVNDNGVQDPGEPGIIGVTLDLIDLGADGLPGGSGPDADTVVSTTTTSGNGKYLFTGVAAGTYQVDVTDVRGVLAGLSLSPTLAPIPEPTDPFTIVIPAGTSTVILDKDFGYFNPDPHTLTDSVWLDSDRDGVRDGGEVGFAGVTVSLLNEDGDYLASTTSDANGVFSFDGLIHDAYRLVVTDFEGVLDGHLPTTQAGCCGHPVEIEDIDVSGNNFGYNLQGQLTDYSATTATSQTDTVVDVNILTYDFGYTSNLIVIGDTVFSDTNGDGVQDPGEPGIPGVCVNLRDGAGNLITRTPTDTNGSYAFTVLPGDYTVEVCDRNLSSDPLGRVGDRVWLDLNNDGVQDPGEPGLPNASVVLRDAATDAVLAATSTDGNGLYSFNNLLPGSYYTNVVESTLPAGLSLTPGSTNPSSPPVTITNAGETFDGLDFGYGTAGQGAIGDFVWFDSNGNALQDPGESGISNVVVNLLSGGVPIATTSTAGGYYLFAGLPAGNYTVDIASSNFGPGGALEGLTMSGGVDPAPVPLGLSEINLNVDFGYRSDPLYSIADRVWADDNRNRSQDGGELGIPGVTVVLLDDTGFVIAQTTTDANGDFSFAGLPPGDYRLAVTDVDGNLADLLPTTDPAVNGLPVALTNADVNGINFGYAPTGQLEDFANTTGGDEISRTVVTDDDTFDFGYFVPDRPCAKCEGKVTTLTLKYLGDKVNARIKVKQKKDGDVVFDGIVQPGDSFTFWGTWKGTLGTEILVYIKSSYYWKLDTKIHTSCSQPIGPGLVFGHFEVIAGESLHGGPLCPVECVVKHDDDSSDGDDSSGDGASKSEEDSGSKSSSESGSKSSSSKDDHDSRSEGSKSGGDGKSDDDSSDGDDSSGDGASGERNPCACPHDYDDYSSDGDDSSGDGASRTSYYHRYDDASSDDDDSSRDGASSDYYPNAFCGPGPDDASSGDDDSSGDGASNDHKSGSKFSSRYSRYGGWSGW